MRYVERTLGFRTKPLDPRATRLNVILAKAALRPGAGNMVNAILRSVASYKEKDTLPLPKVEGDDRSQARALSVIYSHPVWMIRRWTMCFGQQAAIQLMEWNNSRPGFSLRANNGRGVSRDDLVILLNKLEVPHQLSPYMVEFVRLSTGLQRADLRWKKTLKDLEQLIILQDDLLEAASSLVKPGGIFVYSTCSIDPRENEERVESFLARHPEFVVEAVDKFVPSEFTSEKGFYVSHPTTHFLDGAFAARMCRAAD